ncbi:SRPBCC domain-containing protein [Brevibacillus composti]|uniref:SRPBCC domain-containing protein n=2 Tax=Brevibacillus composti TaxID=2796470 RepID=A0A7T5JN00_9BACL|nr:SRPBCC domain-containing protein [Brevibacillus composti]QUO40582.1 SRPBCC domain-containing protein [Brevibacillus composti]
MHGPDGTDYPNKITFLEMDAPERLVYAHGDDEDDEHFRVTVTFRQEEDQTTTLTMRMQFKTAELLEQSVKEYGAIEGAEQTLDRLEEQLPKVMLIRAQGQTFAMERIFDAPRELVFQAFSQAEHLKNWWGPRGWTLPVSDLDFRPGGTWHYCMKCVDPNQGDFYGFESWGKSVYHEIVEGEKIVYIDYFSDAEGNESKEFPSSKTTLRFFDYQGKTKVVSETLYDTPEALKTVIDMGMEQGITETWDRLAEHLQSVQ